MIPNVTVIKPWGHVTLDGQLRTWAATWDGRPDWAWECLHGGCRLWHTAYRTQDEALTAGRDHLSAWCDRPGAPRPVQPQTGPCRPRGTEITTHA